MSTRPKICDHSAVPPNTENQRKPSRLGAITTPRMNSRISRPREIRAMNAPTNGAHAIHQAQQKIVQSATQLSRSEERRVGKACVRTCRTRWARDNKKKKTKKNVDRQ